MLCSSMAGCIFEDGSESDAADVLAVFSFSPSKNIKAGTTVSFDASSSTPNDGSLTYRWNFDTEGSIDIDATGLTATWSFDEAKTYKVTLEVSDGTTTSEQTRDVTVYAETAQPPTPPSRSTPTQRTARTNPYPSPVIFWCGYVHEKKRRLTGP